MIKSPPLSSFLGIPSLKINYKSCIQFWFSGTWGRIQGIETQLLSRERRVRDHGKTNVKLKNSLLVALPLPGRVGRKKETLLHPQMCDGGGLGEGKCWYVSFTFWGVYFLNKLVDFFPGWKRELTRISHSLTYVSAILSVNSQLQRWSKCCYITFKVKNKKGFEIEKG